MTESSNRKERLAQNTIILSFRLVILLLISLYTSRVTLSCLGVENYGIYNIVGGIVVLFSFLTSALTSSTQRFLNYSLALNQLEKVKQVFNTSLLAHIILCAIVLLIAETFGLFFLLPKLEIPGDRMDSAISTFHLAVATTLIGIVTIPYRSAIIAVERMSILAYFSVLESILKLLSVIIISAFEYDGLVIYSFLIFLSNIVIFLIYVYGCRVVTDFTWIKLTWKTSGLKEQINFSAWYLFGGLASVASKQGSNIIINFFYGLTANASVGIANQIRNAIFSFVSSFQMAFNPQLVKLYASRNSGELTALIYASTKFSFFFLFIISIPILLFCNEILSIWLIEVPRYAPSFSILIVVTSYTEALSAPIWTTIGASGRVKIYQFCVSLIMLTELPISYVLYCKGTCPETAFIVGLIVSIIAYIFRLAYMKRIIEFCIATYVQKVIFPCLIVVVASLVVCLPLYEYSTILSRNPYIGVPCVFIITILVTTMIGLTREERSFAINLLRNKFNINR